MPITVDDSRRPIIVATFVGAPTDPEFDEYLATMLRAQTGHPQRTVTVFDALRSENTTAAQRRRQAEWLKANHAALQRDSVGNVFVIGSPLVRGVLTAILWMQPLPVPHTVVGTMAEGMDAARAMLAKAGVR